MDWRLKDYETFYEHRINIYSEFTEFTHPKKWERGKRNVTVKSEYPNWPRLLDELYVNTDRCIELFDKATRPQSNNKRKLGPPVKLKVDPDSLLGLQAATPTPTKRKRTVKNRHDSDFVSSQKYDEEPLESLDAPAPAPETPRIKRQTVEAYKIRSTYDYVSLLEAESVNRKISQYFESDAGNHYVFFLVSAEAVDRVKAERKTQVVSSEMKKDSRDFIRFVFPANIDSQGWPAAGLKR